MDYLKWGCAAALLLCLPACGPREPARGAGRPPTWARGEAEVCTYAGPLDREPRRAAALARLVVSAPGVVPAPSAGARDERLVRMELSVRSPAASEADSVLTFATLRARDLDVTGVSVTRFRGRERTLVEAIPDSAGGVRVVERDERSPRARREVRLRWPAGERPHVYWDALPVWLRAWAGESTPLEMRVWMLPSLAAGVPLASPVPVDAVIRRLDGGTIRVPAGRFPALQFAVSSGWQADVFWLDADEPHELLRVRAANRLALDLRGLASAAAPGAGPP